MLIGPSVMGGLIQSGNVNNGYRVCITLTDIIVQVSHFSDLCV